MQSFTFVAGIILFIQGLSTWLYRGHELHVRHFGVLTMALSILVVITYEKFVAGPFLLSREFGYLMADSQGGNAWLSTFIIGYSVLVGLAWRIARIATGHEVKIPWYLATGLVIGLISAAAIKNVQSSLSDDLHIYVYDIWWPPLVIWVTASLVGSVISVLRLTKSISIGRFNIDIAQPGGIGVVVTLLAFMALKERSGVFNDVQWFWTAILLLTAPVSLALIYHASIHRAVEKSTSRWKTRLMAGVFIIIGILLAVFAIDQPEHIKLYSIAWIIMVGAAVSPLIKRRIKDCYNQLCKVLLDNTYREIVANRVVLSLLLIGIAFGTYALLLNVNHIDIEIAVSLLFISLIVFIDVVWQQGLISRTWRFSTEPSNAWPAVKKLSTSSANILGSLLNKIGAAFSAESWYGKIFKVILGIALLVALSEIPNAGKTIIMPFKVSSDVGNSELGEMVSDRIVYELKLFSQQLTHEIALVNPKSKNLELYGFELDTSEQIMKKAGAIKLPGDIELPVQLLLWPVQQPMRWLLNVNVINGNLVKDANGYALFATSSRGRGWHVDTSRLVSIEKIRTTTASAPPGSTQNQSEQNQADNKKSSTKDADKQTDLGPLLTILPDLAKNMAFQIVVDNKLFQQTGIPQKLEAYEEYNKGLQALNDYLYLDASAHRFTNLNRAIAYLKHAVTLDQTSESAYYRLGLALKEDRQAYTALAAFEKSLEVNPNFVPAKVALAYHKTYPTSFYIPLPPGVTEKTQQNIYNFDNDTIVRLWQTIISDPAASPQDLASAYAVLSNLELEILTGSNSNIFSNPETAGNEDQQAHQSKLNSASLSGYYFARRAIDSYRRLQAQGVPVSEIAPLQADALNTAGVILDLTASIDKPIYHDLNWTCLNGYINDIAEVWKTSPYTTDALAYYQEANKLSPHDIIIACNYAQAALVLGKPHPMQYLARIPSAYKYVGDNTLEPINLIELKRKLSEYRMAITLDPTDTESRNNFAYTFYSFRYYYPEVLDHAWVLLDLGLEAEKHSHEAVRLARITNHPDLVIYQSTLAEVLMAIHRYKDAVALLEEISIPDHSIFFEVMWDKAQAYSCLAQKTGNTKFLIKAQKQLLDIRLLDQSRDVPLFEKDPSILDALYTPRFCLQDDQYSIYSDSGITSNYQISTSRYTEVEPCDRNALWVTTPPDADLAVRVWGLEGLNELNKNYTLVNEGHEFYNVLSWEPLSTTDEFFVRLYKFNTEMNEYQPASGITPLTTYTDCKENGISITYEALQTSASSMNDDSTQPPFALQAR